MIFALRRVSGCAKTYNDGLDMVPMIWRVSVVDDRVKRRRGNQVQGSILRYNPIRCGKWAWVWDKKPRNC